MSLSVLMRSPQGIVIATDTLHYHTETGPLAQPAKKYRVLKTGSGDCVFVAIGETEINGKSVLDLIQEKCEGLEEESVAEDLHSFLLHEWSEDIAQYPWENQEEKDDHIAEARISVLLASSPTRFSIIDGTFDNFRKYSHERLPVASAMGVIAPIRHLLEEPPKARLEWPAYLSKIFSVACAESTVGAPIDIICWNMMESPSVRRYQLNDIVSLEF